MQDRRNNLNPDKAKKDRVLLHCFSNKPDFAVQQSTRTGLLPTSARPKTLAGCL